MTLIWFAPSRISSRTACCTAGTPSATRPMPPVKIAQPQGSPVSIRSRKSPCPPVWLIARPEMNRRGPTNRSCSTASRRPRSAPPASRTVVKPRSSMPRMILDAAAAMKEGGNTRLAARPELTRTALTWTWQSIRPGITVRPPRSMIVAPCAGRAASDNSEIRPSAIRTDRAVEIVPSLGSSRAQFVSRVAVIGRRPSISTQSRAGPAPSRLSDPLRSLAHLIWQRNMAGSPPDCRPSVTPRASRSPDRP